jgi:2-polyprenyl-3-methyl-5-hydroxy-6-metoxy-1,4-benzoquinol methylase
MAKPESDPSIERLKERAWREVAAIDRALDKGKIDEAGWHEAMASLIRPAYLQADNPYAGAGHGGDAVSWESSRGLIAEALDRNGALLDVGCASGILMESVVDWGARKDLRIEPYGLDIVSEFVEMARNRLPHWADRIELGNIRTWVPTRQRFDLAIIRPEYAPVNRRTDMVRHILANVLRPDGRLIVFVGTEEIENRSVETSLSGRGITVHGRVEKPHPKDARLVRRLFWIDGDGMK